MTKKSSDAKASPKTKSSRFEELQKHERFPEFLQMLKLTDRNFTGDFDDLSLKQQREVINKFWAWLESNAPGLQMPELKAKKVRIDKIYRVKEYGKQFLFYVDENGQKVGLELKKIFGTKEVMDAEDPKKKKTVEDLDNLVRTDKKYTIPYTEAKSKELMQIAEQTSVQPTLYFLRGNRKIQVTEPENFTGDFDELMKKSNKGEVI